MPITRKQFELGINSAIEQWMRKIHSYLVEHKDEAYTEDELASQLGVPRVIGILTTEDPRPAFSNALEKLAEWGVVEARIVKGEVYYSYGPEPLDRFPG